MTTRTNLATTEPAPNHVLSELDEAIDGAARLLERSEYQQAFEILTGSLSDIWDRASNSPYLAGAEAAVRAHPVMQFCQQDPFTARAYRKPRGYAGDAVMLDYIYAGRPPEGTSPVGEGVFGCTTRGPMGLSITFRRSLITAYINDVIARKPNARILSVAAGHCRELEGSLALQDGYAGEFIAFDQDPESCDEVRRAYGDRVTVVPGNVRTLMAGSHDLGQFDLVYSAGLYDYLSAPVAARLTAKLKTMLVPGGRLLTANFSDRSHGRGYMEWVMDWRLIYRSKEAFAKIVSHPRDEGTVELFSDPHDNVIYASFRKA